MEPNRRMATTAKKTKPYCYRRSLNGFLLRFLFLVSSDCSFFPSNIDNYIAILSKVGDIIYVIRWIEWLHAAIFARNRYSLRHNRKCGHYRIRTFCEYRPLFLHGVIDLLFCLSIFLIDCHFWRTNRIIHVHLMAYWWQFVIDIDLESNFHPPSK